MKRALFVLVVIALVGCTSTPEPGPAATVLSQTSQLEGSGVIGSILVGGVIPLNYPMKFSGNGTLTWQYPAMPYVVIDGELLIEPILPYEEATRQAILEGRLVIRQSGKPQGLVPVGTILE